MLSLTNSSRCSLHKWIRTHCVHARQWVISVNEHNRPLHSTRGSSSGVICKLSPKRIQSMKSYLDQCFAARKQICQNVQMRQATDFKSSFWRWNKTQGKGSPWGTFHQVVSDHLLDSGSRLADKAAVSLLHNLLLNLVTELRMLPFHGLQPVGIRLLRPLTPTNQLMTLTGYFLSPPPHYPL